MMINSSARVKKTRDGQSKPDHKFRADERIFSGRLRNSLRGLTRILPHRALVAAIESPDLPEFFLEIAHGLAARRDETAILRRLEPRFETAQAARAWYEDYPLPGLSGATSMQLVQSGRGHDVIECLESADEGIYA